MTATLAPSNAADPSDDRMWQHVADRSPAHDDAVVYAVTSTGIYCRPTCAVRQLRRANVRFFAGIEGAEAMGFRACKRCRPSGVSPLRERIERVHVACTLLQRSTELSVASLARHAGVSSRSLQRDFQLMLGISPREFASACRLSHFKLLLSDGRNFTDAIYEAGCGSTSRLYEHSHALGMSPGEFQRGASGETTRVTAVDTAFGVILIAGTDIGTCAVRFGGSADDLLAELKGEFPDASFVQDDDSLEPWARMIVSLLDGHAPLFDLPFDVQGSVFQLRVWEALRRIPPCQIRTYDEIAAEVGVPSGVRAVGNACNANPVALAIPCHRVVPASGGIGQYRSGRERKAALLKHEGAAITEAAG
jgi:AraC family transcriptional regulator of adaptative response/methylated-DNA-[protein]-cysteine methyltransferase